MARAFSTWLKGRSGVRTRLPVTLGSSTRYTNALIKTCAQVSTRSPYCRTARIWTSSCQEEKMNVFLSVRLKSQWCSVASRQIFKSHLMYACNALSLYACIYQRQTRSRRRILVTKLSLGLSECRWFWIYKRLCPSMTAIISMLLCYQYPIDLKRAVFAFLLRLKKCNSNG